MKDSEVKTLELRIQKLVDAAKLSIDGSRNSFFGAILWARKNQTLDERVRDILDGLESKISYNEKNLHYYFNYIIALHGDGFYFLTKEVLAKAIGCEVLTLNTQILEPLKDEAAILEEMKLVLARHDVFAERAKELLKEEVDFNKIIGELAVAAEKLFTNKSIGDIEIGKWNKLKEVGYGKVAQAITEALANDEELVKNPINTVFYANVLVENAKKAREKGDTNFFEKHINEAQKIYLKNYDKTIPNRGYLTDWGVFERKYGDKYFSIVLSSIALCDEIKETRKDYKQVKMRINSLITSLKNVYSETKHTTVGE